MGLSLALSPAAAWAGGRHDGRPRASIEGLPGCATRIAKLRQKSSLGGLRRDRPDHENPPTWIDGPRRLRPRRGLSRGGGRGRRAVFSAGRGADRLAVAYPQRNARLSAVADRLDRRCARSLHGRNRAEPGAARRSDGLPSGDGGEGREGRPDPEPDRQGASDPSHRQRELFRAARRRQRTAVAAGKHRSGQGHRAGPHRRQSRHARQAFQRQEPARRIAPPGRAVANEPRAGRGGWTTRRGDRNRQSPLL